ncbi:MAG: hypothetical protein JO080_01530 [Mucilaginibacter sp.]|nr:hypothetical protein [Mucilaginibacter sp.]
MASGCHHDKKHSHKKQKHIKNKDTLFVTQRSAISVWLDTATLEKRKRQYGNADFYTVADDDVYYASIADSVLKAQKLTLIDTRQFDKCKYLKFVQSNGAMSVVRIDTLAQLYTLYLFDPSRAPHEADIADMDEEYKNFYH